MVIDTVMLKASYNLQTKQEAVRSAVKKFASDIQEGKSLCTLKIPRFFTRQKRDFLKFNFPVCGSLSSTDLMTMYSLMNGFKTIVVGNAETERRINSIVRILSRSSKHNTNYLDHMMFVREIDFPITASSFNIAQKTISFVNTQIRGCKVIPKDNYDDLIMIAAGDLPLMFDMYRHALDLSKDKKEFVINLNALNLLQKKIPEIKRNAYHEVRNSLEQIVRVKENNVFAATKNLIIRNNWLFNNTYSKRSGGKYLSGIIDAFKEMPEDIKHEKLLRMVSNQREIFNILFRALPYIIAKSTGIDLPSLVPPIDVAEDVANMILSPGNERTAYVDACNDDPFTTIDIDGMNNDLPLYNELFRRNFDSLEKIIPYPNEVYAINEVLEKDTFVFNVNNFSAGYNSFINACFKLIQDKDELRSLGIIEDSVIWRMQNLNLPYMDDDGRIQNIPKEISDQVIGIERYLKEDGLTSFYDNMNKYLINS